jgi:hypothetical protein
MCQTLWIVGYIFQVGSALFKIDLTKPFPTGAVKISQIADPSDKDHYQGIVAHTTNPNRCEAISSRSPTPAPCLSTRIVSTARSPDPILCARAEYSSQR